MNSSEQKKAEEAASAATLAAVAQGQPPGDWTPLFLVWLQQEFVRAEQVAARGYDRWGPSRYRSAIRNIRSHAAPLPSSRACAVIPVGCQAARIFFSFVWLDFFAADLSLRPRMLSLTLPHARSLSRLASFLCTLPLPPFVCVILLIRSKWTH